MKTRRRSSLEDDAVSWAAVFEAIDSGVDIRECEFLNEWCDLMAGTEFEHAGGGGRAAERRAREGALAHDEREGGERDGLGNGSDCVEAAFRSERGDVAHPIERDGDCADDEIEAVGFGFHGLRIAGIHNAVGTELFEFLGFIGGGSEGSDFAAPFIKKLHGEVTETSDANDSNSVCGPDSEFDDGAEDCDASAEERTGTDGGKGFGKFCSPSPMGADKIGEATVAPDDGPLACGTEVVVTAHALRTGHAAFGKPAKAHSVTGCEVFDHRTNGLDTPHDFVSGHERVGGKAPLVAEHAEIRVTDAAVFDTDVDMLGADGREFVGEGFKGRCRGLSGVSVNSGHGGIIEYWFIG